MKPDARDRRREFCARFKDERQRRDRSIVAIAAATKVQASLLEAFERGDVSKWPKGIYRRAFFRDYVTAIGLPAGQHVAEFVELFPDADESRAFQPAPAAAHASVQVAPLRIMLAEHATTRAARTTSAGSFQLRTLLRRIGTAAADLMVVALVGLALSRWLGGLWPATGIVACVYYSLSTALFGRSAASELFAWKAWNDAVKTAASSLGIRTRAAIRSMRARAPELTAFASRMSETSAVRELRSKLRLSNLRPQSRRDRELAELRRRRAESAKRSNEEVSEVLG